MSGVQFYKASSVYRLLCSPPKAKSPSITIHPLLPSSTSPHLSLWSSPHCCHCLRGFFFLLVPSPFSLSNLRPPSPLTAQSVLYIYASVPILFIVYFVHQILPISKIIWYLYFSDWLISLSKMFSRSIHAVTKGKISFFPAE